MKTQDILRENEIKLIESYHHDLGNQSWLAYYIDNCKTGNSLDTISNEELALVLAYMEDDYEAL
jgi:hypothetical protein|nr:MAG TPA: hypothetical protein [Bacteriophage sp.]